jgi:hypothetical protein
VLSLVFAAAVALGPRPTDLVRPGEEANYARWLEGEARTAAGYFARLDCAAATLTPAAFEPTTDQAIARQHQGAMLYLERFTVKDCGFARAQGLVVMRDRRTWLAFPTAPGESRASLELQRQMLPSVILTVKQAADRDVSCSGLDKARSALVYDTRVTRPPEADGQPWTERWFMAVCDAGYKVDIDFSPVEGRVSYAVRLAPEPATGLRRLGLLGRSQGE